MDSPHGSQPELGDTRAIKALRDELAETLGRASDGSPPIPKGWPPRYATMIAGSVKYLVIGAASTPFASGFADDVQVYLDRYPNLTQAHRLRADAERIDHDSFELGLDALVRGLEEVYRSVA